MSRVPIVLVDAEGKALAKPLPAGQPSPPSLLKP